jgi:predicted HTH transcriptional regulator
MLRTVVAFANTIGGDFVIGLRNKTWEVVGIDDTDLLLCRDWDRFKSRFTQLVSDKVVGVTSAPRVLKDTSFGRTIAIIKVSQLPKPRFKRHELAYLKSTRLYYKRSNGDSVVLEPSDLADYCDEMLARKGS